MKLVPLSGIYAINGIYIPQPTSADVEIEGIQSFALRTADGLMHKETIAYKRNIPLKYDALTAEEVQTLLNMVLTVPPTEYFYFTYIDPQKGISTIQCYANKFLQSLYLSIKLNGLYLNVNFNCVER